MVHLKIKIYHVAEIKSEPDGNNMQDPPARFISHEVFKHITSREYGQVHIPWLFLCSVLSTSQP